MKVNDIEKQKAARRVLIVGQNGKATGEWAPTWANVDTTKPIGTAAKGDPIYHANDAGYRHLRVVIRDL